MKQLSNLTAGLVALVSLGLVGYVLYTEYQPPKVYSIQAPAGYTEAAFLAELHRDECERLRNPPPPTCEEDLPTVYLAPPEGYTETAFLAELYRDRCGEDLRHWSASATP